MESQDILLSNSYARAEANLKNKLTTEFLKLRPHHLISGVNVHSNFSENDLEKVAKYREYPYHCDMSRPLLPPARLPRIMLNEEDPALELVTLKNHLSDDKERLQKYCLSHKKELNVIKKKDIKWEKRLNTTSTEIPRYVSDLAEIINKDPDPDFQGEYNWYYTGGTVDSLRLNDTDVLLFPFMGELVCAPMVAENYLWKPLLKRAGKCELDGSLCELKHFLHPNKCIVLARCKWNSSAFMLTQRNNKYNLIELHHQTSEVPYISGDLCPTNAEQYCAAHVDRCVRMWTMTRKQPYVHYGILPPPAFNDGWVSVKYQTTNPNSLLFVDRCCLHYLDTRVPFDNPHLTICPRQHLENCERISLDIPSRYNYRRYIGTNHNILMFDNRSPKCVQQKWKHQFKQPPIMGCTVDRDEKEFVVVSSQINREATVLINSWSTSGTPHSLNFPYSPPDINTTLYESQMQGLCLNPGLRDRFHLSNTGSTLLKNEKDIYLFRQNSIGDIFYQCISHESPLDRYSALNIRSYNMLSSWEAATSAQPQPLVPLTVSDKSNMEHVYQAFTNTRLRYEKEELPEPSFVPSWQQSIEKLNNYMDVLAPELLALWEIAEPPSPSTAAAPHQKVMSWLESADMSKSPFLSQENQENTSTPINTQELISVSQPIDLTHLDDSNALQDLLPKVKTVLRKPKTPKK